MRKTLLSLAALSGFVVAGAMTRAEASPVAFAAAPGVAVANNAAVQTVEYGDWRYRRWHRREEWRRHEWHRHHWQGYYR